MTLLVVGANHTSAPLDLREALASGDLAWPERALGRRYAVDGLVVGGAGRGHGLGYPTANLETSPRLLLPADGVYAAWFTVLGRHTGPAAQAGPLLPGERYPSAVSIGTNPTFSGRTRTVEAFVLDAEADLYGQHVAVDFIARIRGQAKFGAVDDLIEAMGRDTDRARAILESQR